MISKNNTLLNITSFLMAFTTMFTFELYADENKQTPLPEFKSCSDSNRPLLPAMWESGALLQHFSDTELITANIVYDSVASAMRFTLVGMSGGSGDFLLLENGNLYALSDGYPNPTQCQFIATTELKVPGRQWLKKDSLCVGEAKVTNKNLIWWKYKVAPVSAERAANSFSHSAPSPSLKNLDNFDSKPPAGADWIWYHKKSQLPFRTMFSIPNNNYGILGLFTFNYLPTFKALDKTNLPALKSICQSQKNTRKTAFDTNNIEGFLTPHSLSNTQVKDLPSQWVPGLEPTSAELPPAWPVKAEITTFMTSVNYCYAPFPTRVYFDWKAQSQLTSMYWNKSGAIPSTCPQKPEFFVQDALLRGKIGQTYNNTGFIFNKDHVGHSSQCFQVLPGVQIPSWKSVDGCVAKAQLAPRSILNPTAEVVKILRCPITKYGAPVPQNFWTWYSVNGVPMVFMQSNSNTDGTGLNLADYYSFKPGKSAPTGSFDLPNICINQDKQSVPKSCHNCHLPLK
ncbi:MAG: hypothetical protein L3J52_01205 [Proteobacteria bacterium]|nr:hypothetical protein [Pseudomonadota bacterium]